MTSMCVSHNLLLLYVNNKKYNKIYRTAINKITINF